MTKLLFIIAVLLLNQSSVAVKSNFLVISFLKFWGRGEQPDKVLFYALSRAKTITEKERKECFTLLKSSLKYIHEKVDSTVEESTYKQTIILDPLTNAFGFTSLEENKKTERLINQLAQNRFNSARHKKNQIASGSTRTGMTVTTSNNSKINEAVTEHQATEIQEWLKYKQPTPSNTYSSLL